MNLLILTGGMYRRYDSLVLAEQEYLENLGALGPFVAITMQGEGHDFVIHMGVDPTQPINPFARHDIDQLTGLHILCFGPVLLTGLDEDTVKEITRG